VGAELYADGQTDRHNEAAIRFHSLRTHLKLTTYTERSFIFNRQDNDFFEELLGWTLDKKSLESLLKTR